MASTRKGCTSTWRTRNHSQVRTPLTAEWAGGSRSRVFSRFGKQLFIGGDGEFGAMGVTLASFLARELDQIVNHAR